MASWTAIGHPSNRILFSWSFGNVSSSREFLYDFCINLIKKKCVLSQSAYLVIMRHFLHFSSSNLSSKNIRHLYSCWSFFKVFALISLISTYRIKNLFKKRFHIFNLEEIITLMSHIVKVFKVFRTLVIKVSVSGTCKSFILINCIS